MSQTRFSRSLLVLFLATLVFALPAFAQSNSATITGSIFDPSKAVMDHVTVTATHLATNVTQSATSNHSVSYI
jgi:hypothetical protein